jgi:hypothetical protein
MRSIRLLAALLAACAIAATAASGKLTLEPSDAVVMSGLDNPRHLAFGPEGGLYVAEAGHGGAGPCIFIRGATECAGDSGAVSRLWHGKQEQVATGFPSYAPAGGAGATGPHGVSLHGRGGAYVTIGLGGEGDPVAFRAIMGQGFGRIARFQPNGKWRYEDDLAGYEVANNPDGSPVPDSNPYGILAEPGGRVAIDAAGNDLLRVRSNGHISTLGVFPSRPQGRSTDSVPTAVAVGPDGAYYVGEVTGVPFPAGEARVYRVDPPHDPTVFLSGFTAIIDIKWGPDGRLYVLQFATGPGLTGPGVLLRVEANGTRTPVVSGLIAPGGLVFGPDGAAYISNKSVLAGAGEVLRFEL